MRSIVSFEGELSRWRYPLLALPVFFLQHAYALAWLAAWGRTDQAGDWSFLFNPLRSIILYTASGEGRELAAFVGAVVALGAGWVLVTLSFRRSRGANLPAAFAFPALIPFLQLPIILILAVMPRIKRRADPSPETRAMRARGAHAMALGVIAGGAVCLAGAAVGILVFGSYGYTMFLVLPVAVGAVASYVVNRAGEKPSGAVVMGALALGAFLIAGVAIEGAVCIVMATPLIIPLGLLGGAIGEAAARQKRARTTVSCIAALPLLFSMEAAFPPRSQFVSVEAIEVAASPQEVWRAIVDMGEIRKAPSIPFGWLAHPVAGEIEGEGVGVLRRGVFSTGIAYERVTEWEPGKRLWFDVLSNPPALKELSPYGSISTPHADGYFATAYAHFDITPLPGGRSRLQLETLHTLELEPAFYWAPIAQWAVHENKTRVLTHFARRAETAARTGSLDETK
jgi:hypothetical protein